MSANLKMRYIVLIFFTVHVYSQSAFKEDSLKHILKTTSSPFQLNSTKLALAEIYVSDDAQQAIIYGNEASLWFKQNHYEKTLARCYKALGISYHNVSNYELAIYNLMLALHLFENEKNSLQSNEVKMKLSVSYLFANKLSAALNYAMDAKSFYEKSDNFSQLAKVYNNLGLIFQDAGNLDSALLFHQKAMMLRQKMKDTMGMAKSYINIANVYFVQNKFTEALHNYQIALDIATNKKDKLQVFNTLFNISKCYLQSKDIDSALMYAQKAIACSKECDDLTSAKDAYFLMAEISENYHQYKEAYYYYHCGDSIESLIFNLESNKNILELETKYQTEKKEKELVVKSLEVKNQDLQLKKRQLIIYGFILVIIIITGLGLFIYKQYQLKKTAHQLIELQKNLVEIKNREITDSILYAKNIQNALLPNSNQLTDIFRKDNYFVNYLPKDIVSGDFYWACETTNAFGQKLIYLAVCDSTGHGVPGAFMSILSMGFLNEAIKEKKIYEPGDIFNEVRKSLISKIGVNGRQDGFDGILLCINKSTGNLSYAASNIKPILMANDVLDILPCDKMPVGEGIRTDSFKTFAISAQAGNRIYLFTDGYCDQFGGPKGKKFMQKQLQQLLLTSSECTVQKQSEEIKKALKDWQGNVEQVDDILVFGIQL